MSKNFIILLIFSECFLALFIYWVDMWTIIALGGICLILFPWGIAPLIFLINHYISKYFDYKDMENSKKIKQFDSTLKEQSRVCLLYSTLCMISIIGSIFFVLQLDIGNNPTLKDSTNLDQYKFLVGIYLTLQFPLIWLPLHLYNTYQVNKLKR